MKILRQREVWSELRSDCSAKSQMAADELELLISETRAESVEDLAAKVLIAFEILDEDAPDDDVTRSLIRDAIQILYRAKLSGRATP